MRLDALLLALALSLVNGTALTDANRSELTALLTSMPPGLYPHLRSITVDQPASLPVLSETICPRITLDGPPGVPAPTMVIPCAINILSGGEGLVVRGEFPDDLPGPHPVASQFAIVAAHELGHQIALFAHGFLRRHPDDPVVPIPNRGYGPWAEALIAEAGCDPSHYLRSMFPRCFFRDNPQEFVASMVNQWMLCSRCVVDLAMARWRQGVPHPLNQAVFLAVLFSAPPRGDWGQITAYSAMAKPEVWSVGPWRCGGPSVVVGPNVVLHVSTDVACRVVDAGM